MRPVSASPAHGAHGAHAPRHDRGGGGAGEAQRQRAPAGMQFQDTFEAAPRRANPQQVSAALAGDPAAQQAFQKVQASGNSELMGQLSRMSGNPELLRQVVKDVADPDSIRQGKGNEFCAATTALSDLAGQDPAEYARLAADLSTTGRTRTADGKVITAQQQSPGQGEMSATQRLMAPALTERANGKRYDVNANGVSHADGRHPPGGDRR